jgi:hypothetical protein
MKVERPKGGTLAAGAEERTAASLEDAVAGGVVAGLPFCAVEILFAAIAGRPPLVPFRYAASLLMGPSAFHVSPVMAVTVGVLLHLGLCSAYGGIYSLVSPARPHAGDVQRNTEFGRGALFAFLLWLFNFQIVARSAYPWFMQLSQPLQAVVHVVFFGVPLAVMKISSRRRPKYEEELPEIVHNGAPPYHRES